MPSPSAVAAASTLEPTVSALPLTAEPHPADTLDDAGPNNEGASAGDPDPALDWRAYVPTDTADHLATMDRAAHESGCGVPWHLLAAIARVESNFGRNMATSSAGALGYGQFLPSSWRVFGNEGNVYDYRDALPAIASYLCQSGLARDPRAALFAYNHADWYVDLVLDLAMRYDRMAPGAPIPDVLEVGPSVDINNPLRYAPGRDLRRQTSARQLADPPAAWLGVPWRGRESGAAVSRTALDATALTMLRVGLGVSGNLPPARTTDESQAVDLRPLADSAWQAGLLPLRAPTATVPSTADWSVDDVRTMLATGRPVVALVAALALPGHAGLDRGGDQPIVIVGITATGFIYHDPSFSSTLGYGLEIDAAQFVHAWSAATRPRQALAFARRPTLAEPRAHRVEPAFPPVITRLVRMSTVVPQPIAYTTAEVVVEPGSDGAANAIQPADESTTGSSAAPPSGSADYGGPPARPLLSVQPDRVWAGGLALAVLLGTVIVLRQRRARWLG